VADLDGRVALITGGAGSIGAATAPLLAAEGARVVVSDLDEPARGIRVNTVHPGPVDNAFRHAIEVVASGRDESEAATI
jgi:NAD(P)-dependent dehydrogenase (short-subunit alcohol dehydrogenase family)